MKKKNLGRRGAAVALSSLMALSLAAPVMAEDAPDAKAADELVTEAVAEAVEEAAVEEAVAEAAEDAETEGEEQETAVVFSQVNLSRGDVLLVLYGMDGLEETEVREIYSDVAVDSVYADAAAWATDAKIVNGYGDGSFRPEEEVTREQLATMLYRYAQTKGEGFQGAWMFLLSYDDAAEISEWADEAMHWMSMNEIFTVEDNRILPKATVSAEEFDGIYNRLRDTLGMPVGGMTLEDDAIEAVIPEEYADLVVLNETADNVLLSVSEKASLEAAAGKDYETTDGIGWLFDVVRLDEKTVHELLCNDMSGIELFATDGEGTYYAICHPTDVRIERADQITEADLEAWTFVNGLSEVMEQDIIERNGLTPYSAGNSEIEIELYRILYQDGAKYSLTFLTDGEQQPADAVDAAEYIGKLLDGVSVEYVQEGDEVIEGAEGEYDVLNLGDDTMLYFYRAGQNYVRLVRGEDFSTLYKLTYADGIDTVSSDVVNAWYEALVDANK